MRTDRLTATILLTTALTPIAWALPAAAQEETAGREVITVTARRVEETLQSTPVAVTAVSGAALEEIGAQDITALGQTTPNVTLETSRATNSTLTAFIRGVGQQDPVAGFEQGVGIYLDDVYLNRPQAAQLDLYDVQRIEILRGPQGTLYGRNTIGGAVKYVTNPIDAEDPTLKARLAVGSYNQLDGVVSGSAPITDSFRIGGAIAKLSRDGFGENLTTNEDNYNKDVFGVRGSAELDIGEAIQVRLSGDYTRDESNNRHGYRLLPSTLVPSQPLRDRYDTNAGVAAFSPTFDAGRVEASGAQLAVDWQVNENLTLKSITSFREDDTDSLIDFDSTPLPTFDAWVEYTNEQMSQEIQAIFGGDRWNAVLGGYYLDANAFNAFDVLFTSVTSFTLGDVDTKTWALFGEVEFDVTDKLAITLGGRYTEDERTSRVQRETFLGTSSPYFGNTTAVSLTAPVVVNGEQVVPTFNGSRTDDAFTPRVIASYEVSPDLNVYASYSQGFKGGGFDPRGNFANPDVREGFKPEFVDSYELGLKGAFFDGRFLANTALFRADYTDVQIPGSVIVTDSLGNTTFVGTVTNAGAAEFTGLELETTAFITDRVTAFVNLGYIDAEYTEFIQGGVNIAANADVQNTPDWTGAISLNYSQPFTLAGAPGEISLIGTASHRSDTQQFEFPIPLLDQPSFWLYDASLAWASDNGRWTAGLHGKNLSDEDYITSGYNFPTVGASVLAFYGNPRTITATWGFKY